MGKPLNKTRSNIVNIIHYLLTTERNYWEELKNNLHKAQYIKTGTHNFTCKGLSYILVSDEAIKPLHKSLKEDFLYWISLSNKLKEEFDVMYAFFIDKEDYYNYLPDILLNKLGITKLQDRTNEIPEEIYNLILEKSLNILLE